MCTATSIRFFSFFSLFFSVLRCFLSWLSSFLPLFWHFMNKKKKRPKTAALRCTFSPSFRTGSCRLAQQASSGFAFFFFYDLVTLIHFFFVRRAPFIYLSSSFFLSAFQACVIHEDIGLPTGINLQNCKEKCLRWRKQKWKVSFQANSALFFFLRGLTNRGLFQHKRKKCWCCLSPSL